MAKAPEPPKAPKVDIPGEWMFQIDGVIYGPAPAQTVVDRLFSGDLTGESLVADERGEWLAINSHPHFYGHVGPAVRENELYRRRLETFTAHQKRKKLQFFAIGIPTTLIMLLAVTLIYRKATAPPVKAQGPATMTAQAAEELAWADRPPPLVRLGKIKSKTTERLTKAQKAKRRKAALKRAKKRKAAWAAKKRAAAKAAREARKDGKKPKAAPDPNDELAAYEEQEVRETLTDSQVMRIVNSKLGTLLACVRAEAKRGFGLPDTIMIDFTINNDGRIGRAEVDNRELADGNLESCVKKKMRRWKFPSYYGERKNVELPIHIDY